MRKLYHQPLCPFSRKARVFLNERGIEYSLVIERPWMGREEFLQLNPAARVPVLMEDGGLSIAGSSVICEYADELVKSPSLFGKDIFLRAEARRLQAWFDEKFFPEVTHKLVFEKTIKQQKKLGGPDSALMRQGRLNLMMHAEYFEWLLGRRDWLAGEVYTIADITAAAHFSCLDYLNQVPWDKLDTLKEWYTKIKSRPSFRSILSDRYPAIPPSANYADLDF